MRIEGKIYDLVLEVPFAIARNTTSRHSICIAEIQFEGFVGYGEASPSGYYGDSTEKAMLAINGAGKLLEDPFAMEKISRALLENFPDSPSGRAAIEIALYDLLGKVTNQPVYRLLGLAGMDPPMTSYTVGVEDVAIAERRLEVLRQYPILKVKLGFGDELRLLELLSSETNARLRADANEGWQLDEAIEKINSYGERFNIEFFEQPLPKNQRENYRKLKRETRATIIVDESVVTPSDILEWADIVDGINIKLMKCGGIAQALKMIWTAKSAGLKVMLGCMIESSVGITAAAHLAPLVEYCDLDGNLLITNDPFTGVKAVRGILGLPTSPGLGVKPTI